MFFFKIKRPYSDLLQKHNFRTVFRFFFFDFFGPFSDFFRLFWDVFWLFVKNFLEECWKYRDCQDYRNHQEYIGNTQSVVNSETIENTELDGTIGKYRTARILGSYKNIWKIPERNIETIAVTILDRNGIWKKRNMNILQFVAHRFHKIY